MTNVKQYWKIRRVKVIFSKLMYHVTQFSSAYSTYNSIIIIQKIIHQTG